LIFLSPHNRPPVENFVPADSLPMLERKPTAVFLSRLDDSYWALLRAYYPQATVSLVHGPDPNAEALIYQTLLGRRDLNAIRGLNLTSANRRAGRFRVPDHSGSFVGPRVPGDMLWWGGLHVQQYQRAELKFRAPGFITVQIDRGRPCAGMNSVTCGRVWPSGNHPVAVRVTRVAPSSTSRLSWSWTGRGGAAFFTPPLTSHGLVARYYANANWRGQPIIARVEPDLYYYYQYLQGVLAPWSARWAGQIHIPRTGKYHFSLTSIDGSSVSIGGREILRSVAFPNSATRTVTLRKGWHSFGARLRGLTSGYRIYLSWIPAGSGDTAPVPIPTTNFRV
jgi:hypothetical protein